MKRVQSMICVLLLAGFAVAQAQQQKPEQPSQSSQPAQTGQSQAAPVAEPHGKPLPQAKSQEEFKAYQEAAQAADAAAAEASADNFAAKFKDSELRTLLYNRAMVLYQNENNRQKVIEVGRKILAIDPTDPVANVFVATFVAEGTRDTDLDKDERVAEATKDAQAAIKNVDTGLYVQPNMTQEQVDMRKKMILSMAEAALAQVALVNKDYAAADQHFQKSMELDADHPDPLTRLKYAVALDQQKKYSEALTMANKAYELAPAGSQMQKVAQQERDRLVQLAGKSAPAATQAPQQQNTPTTPPKQ